jgi:hypothetical protein
VTIPNVLASRYASDEMVVIWSPEAKVVAERRLWLAVLRAQASLGVDVPEGVVEDYERVIDDVDLSSIAARERVLRHDVKARIEEFNALAGHEHVHKGMTSRDLTENVEQLQIRQSLELVFTHGVAVVARLAERAISYRDLVMAGRSHNVAAQATTLGKRFASAAEEMLLALTRLRSLIDRYPLRGIKGPMGTAQDMLDLFDGDTDKLAQLERQVAEFLGFTEIFTSVGQVYPRSLDHDVVSALVQVGAGLVVARAHHPTDGGPRIGDRGVRARAGRLVGHAAQDEHSVVRAGQRAAGRAAGLRVDGRGTGGRAVERGRRVLLGGAARRAARCVLRDRRADRDVPDRARRVRRLSGGDPA